MPENWKTYNIGEFVDLKQGLAINKKTNHLLCDKGEGAIPLFKIRDLLNQTVEHYVKENEVPEQCIAGKEDLIYSRTGQVGHVFTGRIGCIHNNCFKIIPDSRLYRRFLYHFLKNPIVRQHANDISSGSVQKDLNHTAFKSIEISVPGSLPEQRAIASILSALDDKIENNRAMNKTLEAMAMALYKHWFVDFGPFQDGNFIDSELGLIPEGWEVKRLDEVAFKKSETFDFSNVEEVIFVNTGDVQEGRFLHSNKSSKIGLPGQAKKAISKDDILYSEIRPKNKRFAYVNFDASDYVVSTKFMIINSKNNIENKILYRILTMQSTVDDFNSIADGRSGTFPQITFDAISGMQMVLPPIQIQNEFQNLTSSMEFKQDALYEENQTLIQLRDTLLPKLISGEVRVKDIEKTVSEAL